MNTETLYLIIIGIFLVAIFFGAYAYLRYRRNNPEMAKLERYAMIIVAGVERMYQLNAIADNKRLDTAIEQLLLAYPVLKRYHTETRLLIEAALWLLKNSPTINLQTALNSDDIGSYALTVVTGIEQMYAKATDVTESRRMREAIAALEAKYPELTKTYNQARIYIEAAYLLITLNRNTITNG